MSGSFVIAAAARRTCSSEARFILRENGLAFSGRQQAGERTGLAEPRRFFVS